MKTFFKLILIILINCSNIVASIDSLKTLIRTDKSDTSKIIHLNKLSNEYKKTGEYDKGLLYGKQALHIAIAIVNDKSTKQSSLKLAAQKGLSNSYNIIGNIYSNQGNYLEALKNYYASLNIRKELKDNQGIAASYNNIGIIFYNQGNYPEALKNYFAALKIHEELVRLHPELIEGKKGISVSYNNIGIVYVEQSNYTEALRYYYNALKLHKEQMLMYPKLVDGKKGISDSYNNIGIIYMHQKKYSESLKNHFASLKLLEELGDKQGISDSYNNIGIIFHDQGIAHTNPSKKDSFFNEALTKYNTSLKIRQEIGDQVGIAVCFNNVGELYIEFHKPQIAQNYLNKALQLGIEIGSKERIKESYFYLAESDSILGNYKMQIQNYKLFILYRDSIDNEDTKIKTLQGAMTYEFDKKEIASKAEQDKKDAVATADLKRQKLLSYSVIGGILLVALILVIVIRSLRITRRQKSIIENQKLEVDEKNNMLNMQNEEIRSQRDEIEIQRDTVTKQKEQIEEIHQEVTDSINYAQLIQQAMLPNLNELLNYELRITNETPNTKILNPKFQILNYFVLFKPKDVVSGDFYWATRINQLFIIAVADCTGHGVPGAFMSMLGISFLNEIVRKKEVTQASQVLDQLSESVIDALKQQGSYDDQKDGMDIAFCVINTETMEMQFAGANNPLWIVKSCKVESYNVESENNTENNFINFKNFKTLQTNDFTNFELYELKGDKQTIGFSKNKKPFTNNMIQLQSGDSIYLLSDGYEDQFGGPNRKKFLSKNLKQLITDNYKNPMKEQKILLEKTINNWKGDNEQIDDITILGFKV